MQIEINNTVYDSDIQPITITINKSELNKINQDINENLMYYSINSNSLNSQNNKNEIPIIVTFNTVKKLNNS